MLGVLSGTACSQTYDDLIAMVGNPDPSIHMKGKAKLVQTLKEGVLKHQIDTHQLTDNAFCFGHFVGTSTLDLAVAISAPPHGGNLILLSQKDGRYVPVASIPGLAHIESIQSVNLFSGQADQLALNLYMHGTGLEHWAKDIYRWDGETLRMIWAWGQKEIRKDWPPDSHGEIRGYVIQSDITIGKRREDGSREIVTATVFEKGVFDRNKDWGFRSVTDRSVTKSVHSWDQSLFFYVAKHGRIVSPQVAVPCKEGIPQKKGLMTLKKGTRLGILDTLGFFEPDAEQHIVVIGKEHFCQIPRSAVESIPP